MKRRYFRLSHSVSVRILIILVAAVIPALAQAPGVRLINISRPASRDFQIGDRFEVRISGAPNQPVSVRTTRQSAMDWGPVIGQTDGSGRWSTTGQFEKADFGNWGEAWTVGGKLANPAIRLSVSAPCLKEGRRMLTMSGINMLMNCDTAEGSQTFVTPSLSDSFRTPDGRLISGHVPSVDRYHAEIVQALLTSRASGIKLHEYGNAAADLITEIIGVNALSDNETENALAIIRSAYDDPLRIPQADKDPSPTLTLLRTLADSTDQEAMKQQIDETIVYVQTR
jgi:hypothetical protein